MDTGHWVYTGEFNPSEWFGFIYRVIDLENGKHYIGKKQFSSYKTKTVSTLKGGTKRKKMISESSWKKYTSSSKYLNDAIRMKGKDKFIFIIESLHLTKGGLSYAEIEAQVREDVLRAKLPNGERKFYNASIMNIKFLPPIEVAEEEVMKLRKSLQLFWIDTEISVSLR